MLYAIGPLIVSVFPFNADKVNRETEAAFVEKPVLGRRPPLEAVGEGPQTLSLSGTLFPLKLGGLDELELAQRLQAAQTPLSVMRGDGFPLGWFVITAIREAGDWLAADGVPQVVQYEISLKRDDAPAAMDFASDLFSVAGGGVSP